MKIFLDDTQQSSEVYQDKGWITCRTINDAMKFLRLGGVSVISLDGDMGTDSNGKEVLGGLELLDWMRSSKTWPTRKVLIHSACKVKRAMMETLVEMYFLSRGEPDARVKGQEA